MSPDTESEVFEEKTVSHAEPENVSPETGNQAEEAPSVDKDRAAAKAEIKRRRAEKREKDRLWRQYQKSRRALPENEKSIICPPDKATFSRGKIIRGYAARIAVIALTVFGVAFLLCNSFAIGEGREGLSPGWILFLCSLLFTTIFSLACIIQPRGAAVPAGTVLGVGLLVLFFLPDPFTRMYEAGIAAFNSALEHLSDVGFYAANLSRIDYTYTTGSEAALASKALIAVAFIYSLVYSLCLSRKINVAKLIPAVILSAATPALVFIYNITRSNWGVSITTAAFAAILTLAGYDMIFSRRRRSKKTVSAELIFPDGEDGADPAAARRAKREKRRLEAAEKAKAKREAKTREKTVDEEISEYLAAKPAKAPKEPKKKLTKAERAAAAAEKREAAKKKRAERCEARAAARGRFSRRRTADAGGGFAAIAVFLIAFLLMFIPSLITERPFSTFKALDDKFEMIRTYVTAVLMGDDPVLDLLTYENDSSNFSPRSTDPTPRYYKGTELFKVYSNGRQNVYLRGWIGTDYDAETGVWTTVSPGSEELDAYRKLFGTSMDPSESMMYSFHTLYDPTTIPGEDEFDYLNRMKTNTTIGFAVGQISVMPIERPWSKLVFMPVYNLRSFNVNDKLSSGKNALYLREFAGEGSSKLTYANWYDGIYSSYRYSLPNDGFSVVAMIPTMKNSGFYRTISDRIAAINLGEAQVYEGNVLYYYDSNGEKCRLDYDFVQDELTGEITVGVNYRNSGYLFQSVEYVLDASGKVKSTQRSYLVNENDEDAEYVPVPELPIGVKYMVLGSDWQTKFNHYAKVNGYYTTFVYGAYAKSSGLSSIKDLLNTIVSSATRKDYEEYEETDPETGEVYTLTRQITVPADFSKAAQRNVFLFDRDRNEYVLTTPVSDREVYRQRHELVMEIVNYLADEKNFTYTLTPEQQQLEGVTGIDRFLLGNRQGYCVQFATTLALLLREAGIPARYVDGYIAQSMTPSGGESAGTYATTVRDRNAHAWVEVWFDGIGWVSYEATPPYYDGMYEARRTDPTTPSRPPTGDDDENPDDEPEVDPISQYELERLEEEHRKELRRQLIKKIVTISLSVLAAAAVIGIGVFFIARRAKKAEKKRRDLLARLDECCKRDGPEHSRADVRALSDLLFLVIKECRLTPGKGEFRNEWCERVSLSAAPALKAGVTEQNGSKLQALSEGDVRRAMEAVAAEEFGFGCEKRDLPLILTLYRRLYGYEYKRHVNPLRRLKLHYIDASL